MKKNFLLSLAVFAFTVVSCGVSDVADGSGNNNASNSVSGNNATKYTVSFNLLGGTGDFQQLETINGSVTIPSTVPTNGDLHFVGWNTYDDEQVYRVGDTYSPTKDTTLYALWVDRELCISCEGKGHKWFDNEVKCGECEGKGHLDQKEKVKCSNCKGAGSITVYNAACPVCDGAGYTTTSFRCNYCYHTWSSPYTSPKTVCSFCGKGGAHITGHTSCSNCGGTGKHTGQTVCSKCNGNGQIEQFVACSKCGEDGYVSGEAHCGSCQGLGYSGLRDFNFGPKMIEVTESKVYIDPASSDKYEWSFIMTESIFYFSVPYDGEMFNASSMVTWTTDSEISYTYSKNVNSDEYALVFREKATDTHPAQAINFFRFNIKFIAKHSWYTKEFFEERTKSA